MKAIVISEYGGSDKLVVTELPTPQAGEGEILVKIKAFGINRAETYMRRGLFGDVAKVSGIECVGEVEHDPSGKIRKGQRVAAIMGGMGRTINGSYAEYTVVPAANVMVVHTNMDWAELAALPESYATAWAALHENLKMQAGSRIVVRGGTSALGQAAINIAANTADVDIIATTRSPDNIALLKELGAKHVLIEGGVLSAQIRALYPDGVDGVLDIIGNTTLLDSVKAVKKGGYVCNAGFLGGGAPIPFNPLMDLPSTVYLSLFASFNFGTKDFPLSSIPMQRFVDHANDRLYKAHPKRVFKFDEIAAAHDAMESDQVRGKIVVVV